MTAANESRRVLVVSPHFPPVNLPDMQRVRICLPHLPEFDWQPVVLTVRPEEVRTVQDPLLLETLPPELEVHRVAALPRGLTLLLGIGDVGLRSLAHLYREGCRLLASRRFDLVYFSTTVFSVLILGRLWRRQYGVPFVIDMQDPWVNDYQGAGSARAGLKRRLARRLHRVLEPLTMGQTSGLVAVSDSYIDTLRRRYPRLQAVPAMTLPFGCAPADFEVLGRHPRPNGFFPPGEPGRIHGVYVGRGGDDMRPALEAVFRALQMGLQQWPAEFEPVRLHFIGTDYAPPPGGRPTVQPVADAMGLGGRVSESTNRVPYFDALRLLSDADFLLIPGSDDPGYSASKVYPYVLARKPLLCVFHESSSVVDFVRRLGCGRMVSFRSGAAREALAERILIQWRALLDEIGREPEVRWELMEGYGGRESARRHGRFFETVLGQG